MTVPYALINLSKQEYLLYRHLTVSTLDELAGLEGQANNEAKDM